MVGPNNSICLTGTSCNLQDVKLQGLWSFIPKQTFNRIWGPIKPKLVSNVRRLIYQWANGILILAYFAAVILDFIIRFNETPRATLVYLRKAKKINNLQLYPNIPYFDCCWGRARKSYCLSKRPLLDCRNDRLKHRQLKQTDMKVRYI